MDQAPTLSFRQLRSHAWLELTGKHRHRFLHNMCTAEINGLKPGDSRIGMMADYHGKHRGQFHVLCQDERLLLDGDAASITAIHERLVKHRVADRVVFADVEDMALVHVIGPEGADLNTTIALVHSVAQAGSGELVVRRTHGRLNVPGIDVFGPSDDVAAFIRRLTDAGAVALDETAFDARRIRGGWPKDGVDLTEDHIALESAALYATVDWDKGCYLGQEVIARMHYRGRPQRHLVTVTLRRDGAGDDDSEANDAPLLHTPLMDPESGKQAGWLQSTMASDSGYSGLALIKKNYLETGKLLTVNGTPWVITLDEAAVAIATTKPNVE